MRARGQALHESHDAMLRDRKRNVFQQAPTKLPRTTDRLLSALPSMTELRKLEKQPTATTTRSAKKASFCSAPSLRARTPITRRVCGHSIKFVHGCFDDVDAGGNLGVCAEVLHEAAMVEQTTLGSGGVWYMHSFSGVEDYAAMH